MGGLAAVHLPADDPLGILHRQAALGVGDIDDEDHQSQHADDDHGDHPGGQGHLVDIGLGVLHGLVHRGVALHHGLGGDGAVLHLVPDADALDAVLDHSGEPGDDTGEQDDGDTVADAELGDLLTQPHQEGGAGGEGQDDDDADPQGGQGPGLDQAVALDQGVVAEALEQGDGHGGVPGDGGDLLPALFAALLGQPLQSGDGHGQQLDDNGAVDIGLDGQGEDRGHGEGGAAHGVHQAQDGAALALQLQGQQLGIDIGDRDRGAETEDQQREDGEQDLLAQLGHSPSVTDRLDHLRSPPPYHPQLRSFP